MKLLFVYTWFVSLGTITLFLLNAGFFGAGHPWYVGFCVGWCAAEAATALARWVTEGE